MSKTKSVVVRDASISIIQQKFKLSDQGVTGRRCPVLKFKEGNYRISILKSQSQNFAKGTVQMSWEYFELDKDGVITDAPRGHKKDYKGFKIVDLEEYIKNWK